MCDSTHSSKTSLSKHRKVSMNSTDRISRLPESILRHILSFLTSKEAAATSVLSKRWKYLWTWVPIIDVDAEEIREEGMSFEQILFKIIFLRREWCIRKFTLSYQHRDYDDFLCSLLRAIVARNVEEFDLIMGEYIIELPPSLFCCKTLVVLRLGGSVAITVDSSVQLPSLKILHLDNVEFKDDETVHNLISGCPILDDLSVYRLNMNDVAHFEISSPTLRTLIVVTWAIDLSIEPLQSLIVNAPSLLYLGIHHCPKTSLVLKNMDNLITAEIDVHHHGRFRWEQICWGSVLDDFRGLCNTRSLRLGCDIMREFNQHISSWDNFPKFNNLVRLKLEGFCCYWRFLQHLLLNCPRLESLTLTKGSLCEDHSSEEPPRWIPPLDVPNCLSSHLNTFKLQGFLELEDLMDFIIYIGRNSKVLKSITWTGPYGMNAEIRFGRGPATT